MYPYCSRQRAPEGQRLGRGDLKKVDRLCFYRQMFGAQEPLRVCQWPQIQIMRCRSIIGKF